MSWPRNLPSASSSCSLRLSTCTVLAICFLRFVEVSRCGVLAPLCKLSQYIGTTKMWILCCLCKKILIILCHKDRPMFQQRVKPCTNIFCNLNWYCTSLVLYFYSRRNTIVVGVWQSGQPRLWSCTAMAHDSQKRWWPHGTSAKRASRGATKRTSQESTASADTVDVVPAASLLLAAVTPLYAVIIISVSSLTSTGCRLSSCLRWRRDLPHVETAVACTWRCQISASTFWCVCRLSD